MPDTALLRKNMVESQVRTNDVTDRRVLRAMLDLPRERFVPEGLAALAYSGEELPLGKGSARSLPAPVTTARLIQLAALEPTDKVLEIGAATGYGTAIIAELAHQVVGVESDAALAAGAKATLSTGKVTNASIQSGPLDAGAAASGPFNVIIVSGAIPDVPDALRNQLAPGGRLVAIIAQGPIGRATVIERSATGFSSRIAFDLAAPALPGFARKPVFAL
jgi:protein-L-isoaspartate(D-aspartate) O-methyltransferase